MHYISICLLRHRYKIMETWMCYQTNALLNTEVCACVCVYVRGSKLNLPSSSCPSDVKSLFNFLIKTLIVLSFALFNITL